MCCGLRDSRLSDASTVRLPTPHPVLIFAQEVVKIHAGNAIRERNQAINFMRLSSRIDAVAGRCVALLCARRGRALGRSDRNRRPRRYLRRALAPHTLTIAPHPTPFRLALPALRPCSVETAIRMNTLSKQMGAVTRGMDTVLGSMDVEKIGRMMDNFEKQFDSLDVRSGACTALLREFSLTRGSQVAAF
jgi:hypothetical protein